MTIKELTDACRRNADSPIAIQAILSGARYEIGSIEGAAAFVIWQLLQDESRVPAGASPALLSPSRRDAEAAE